MSYTDYYGHEHHSPHVVHKSHFDPYPQHPQHNLAPHGHHPASHSHHSSPLLGQHSSPYLGHHLPPRSYPTLEMSSYPDNSEGMVGAGGPVDHGHGILGSPIVEHNGSPSRGGTPTPQSGYYTTLASHDRMIGASRHGSVEPSSFAHTTPLLHHSPHPRTPDLNHRMINNVAPYGPTLKIVQWTPQAGEEGSQVTIVLDALAITGAPPTQYSIPAFGPGSPSLNNPMPHKRAVTRRFVVVFGGAPAPTKFTRAQAIDGNGVGESMDAGPDERDAFVVLTSFVPARQSMGPLEERVMVLVRVVDEQSEILEECIVGEWDALPMLPATPPRYLKRAGEELLSDRHPPALRSPIVQSPRKGRDYLSPPHANSHLSPRTSKRGGTPGDAPEEPARVGGGNTGRHPPVDDLNRGAPQPDLLRTSQIPSTPTVATNGGQLATFSNKAILKLQGDLNSMAMGWSNEEWTNRRRLIQFWRQQEGNVINATFRPIAQAEFVPNSIVISCIFRDEWNECFVTSVDTIYLLEALVGVRFTVEEKNRIRRNLEGFKPQTVSKSKPESEPFFKLIMGFPNPKPRNIEKDVKVFPWKILANALTKIISKYSATYTAPVASDPSPTVQVGPASDDGHDLGPELPALPPLPSFPHSPHLGGPSSQLNSPHIGHSPHFGGHEHFGGPLPLPHSPNPEHLAPGGMGSVHHSPNPSIHSHSHPPSPHVPQSPHLGGGHHHHQQQQQQYDQPPTVVVERSDSPGPNGRTSYDFNGILDSSASGAPEPNHRHATRSRGPAPAGQESASSKDGNEEGGESLEVGAGEGGGGGGGEEENSMPPPPLNHSRAYSDGAPRRPHSSNSGPYSAPPHGGQTPFGAWTPPQYGGGGGQEYYAQDLAGVQSWGVAAPTGYEPLSAGVALRRSSSLEGLREFGETQGWLDR